jgi:N utilization substance protein B
MGTRRKAREYALQLLYQWEGERGAPAALLPGFWRGQTVTAPTREFAEQLFQGAASVVEELDALIAAHAQHWRLERMAAIDRNLLRLAVYEMRAYPKTSPAVVINEALEIAKRFSGAESAEFVNGILDAVRKSPEASSRAPR